MRRRRSRRGHRGRGPSSLLDVPRAATIELCARLKIPCVEKSLQRQDLYIADECFLTGSAAQVIAVTSVDRRPIADARPGPVTRQLMADFRELVQRAE